MITEVKTLKQQYILDEVDRRIIRATQGGLPLTSTPYEDLAQQIQIDTAELMARLQKMLNEKVIRRIAAVPHHYNVGISFNAMTVWSVPDKSVTELGKKVGELEFVSHCYRRPRVPGVWNYNLFAMVHGKAKAECLEKARKIKDILADDLLESEILFSRRVLKKTGFRL